jgi:hypothetical protein
LLSNDLRLASTLYIAAKSTTKTKKIVIDMDKKKEIDYTKIKVTPIQFEQMLAEYGMSKSTYVRLRGYSARSWFYVVLRKRKYLKIADLVPFVNEVGYSAASYLFKKYADTWDGLKDTQD